MSTLNRPFDVLDLPVAHAATGGGEALLLLDERQRVVGASPAALRLFCCPASALLGSPLERLVSSGPDPAQALRREDAACRVTAQRQGGGAFPLEISLSPLETGPNEPGPGRPRLAALLREPGSERPCAGELRQLSASVVEAREEERRRIARELHDELGQRLTALKLDLSALAAGCGGPDDRVAGMLATLDDTVASVRRIAADLRPLMLDDLGLDAAIEWLASDASRRLGLEVGVELDETLPPLGERVAIALYRMVQEALTNVGRHARASQVQVALRREDAELVLTVRDDGIGIPERALQREGSFGLLGMRERARMLGGRFEAGRAPGGGGRVTVRLPLPPSCAPDDPASRALHERP